MTGVKRTGEITLRDASVLAALASVVKEIENLRKHGNVDWYNDCTALVGTLDSDAAKKRARQLLKKLRV
jgi:hypothetical protein